MYDILKGFLVCLSVQLPPHKFIQMGCQLGLVHAHHTLKTCAYSSSNSTQQCWCMRQSAGQWNSVSGSPLNVDMGAALGGSLCRCRQPSRHCGWWCRGRCVSGSTADLSLSTTTRNPCPVSLQTPPNTHRCSSTRPTLFFLFATKLSSISTVRPGPPIW